MRICCILLVLQLLAGNCLATDNNGNGWFEVPSEFTLKGAFDGLTNVPGNFKGIQISTNLYSLGPNDKLRTHDESNFTIEGIGTVIIDGANGPAFPLSVGENSSNIVFKNFTIKNAPKGGAIVNGGGTGSSHRFERVDFVSNEEFGIVVEDQTDIVFSRCDFTDTIKAIPKTGTGCDIRSADGVSFHDCNALRNELHGISIGNTPDATVTDCDCNENGWQGLLVINELSDNILEAVSELSDVVSSCWRSWQSYGRETNRIRIG